MLAAMDSCVGLFRPHQHGIASKQTQTDDYKLIVNGCCSQYFKDYIFYINDKHRH